MLLNLNTTTTIWQRKNTKQFARVTGLLIGGLLFWLLRHQLADFWLLLGNRDRLADEMEQLGLVAPIFLGLLLVLQVIVAVIPGHALMVTAGFLFGFKAAFLLNLTTTVVGSQCAFLISRYFGRPVVERLVAIEQLDKWDVIARNKGALYFMISFMIPIFPADIMNYIAGLSAVEGKKFFVANLVGRVPGVILLTLLGSHGLELPLTAWLALIPLSALMFLLIKRFPPGN